MNKILSLFLCVVLLFSLISCKNNTNASESDETSLQTDSDNISNQNSDNSSMISNTNSNASSEDLNNSSSRPGASSEFVYELDDPVSSSSDKKDPINPEYETLNYPAEKLEFSEVPQYLAQVKNSSGTDWYNGPVDRGLVTSPYFTAKVNGKTYPVYATRATTGLQSFVYVDVTNPQNKPINISAEVKLQNISAQKCTVLPESTNLKANFSNKTATVSFSKTGYYTLIFDEKPDFPITFIVREKEKFEADENATVLRYKPGSYETLHVPAYTMAYFEAGNYELYEITLGANAVIYFEDGTYIKLMRKSGGNGFIHGWAATNSKVYGHALVDMSNQEHGTYCGIAINYSDNFSISGLTFINSSSWTVPIHTSNNAHVYDLVMLGYRMFSDGVTISDCDGAIVENCFARTGDDAFNVKSFIAGSTTNVVTRNCQAWCEKAKGFGVIWETVGDIHDIRFENCAVLFYQSAWHDNLGPMVITSYNPTNIYNIYFDNIEIYKTFHYPICIYGETANTNIRDIHFNNIKMNTDKKILISNVNGGNIGNIYFKNIINGGKKITTIDGLNLKFGGTCSTDNVKLTN